MHVDMFVASTGGHLTELDELSSRLQSSERVSVWVTFDNVHSRYLLDGRNVEYVPAIGQRDVVGCAKGIQRARSLLKTYKPDRVISTGAAIAGIYLPLAPLFGAKSYYIESATRVKAPSMTGKILAKLPKVEAYSQTRECPRHRWKRTSSVFSGFRAEPAGRVSTEFTPKRIVVTVGTLSHYPFHRLFNHLQSLLPESVDILWQVGNAEGLDLPGEVVEYMTPAKLKSRIEEADVVISHAGVGSILMALQVNKSPIVVPRRASFNEHVDDHQLEISEGLAGTNLVLLREVEDISLSDFEKAAATKIVRSYEDQQLFV